MTELLTGGRERAARRRPPLASTVAAAAATGVLVAGAAAAVRLGRVHLVVTEVGGAAVRTEGGAVRADVGLTVRSTGPGPVQVLGLVLRVRGVQARTGTVHARLRPGGAVTVTLAVDVPDCRAAGLTGSLRVLVRPAHGLVRTVVLPVAADGAGGAVRLATSLGFCGPPFTTR